MGMILTYLAVASWCVAAIMLPIAAILVWIRRKNDKTEIIQQYAAEEDEDEDE